METTTRRFDPVFEIREGDTSFGKLIHEQRFPAHSPNFATRDEAFEAAADMGAKWIEANT